MKPCANTNTGHNIQKLMTIKTTEMIVARNDDLSRPNVKAPPSVTVITCTMRWLRSTRFAAALSNGSRNQRHATGLVPTAADHAATGLVLGARVQRTAQLAVREVQHLQTRALLGEQHAQALKRRIA